MYNSQQQGLFEEGWCCVEGGVGALAGMRRCAWHLVKARERGNACACVGELRRQQRLITVPFSSHHLWLTGNCKVCSPSFVVCVVVVVVVLSVVSYDSATPIYGGCSPLIFITIYQW